MKASSVLLLLLLAAPAGAQLIPAALQDVVRRSSMIVEVTITSGHAVQWRSDTGSRDCGIVFEGVVSRTFKGATTQTLAFATERALRVPSQQIVFLRSHTGAFPTDYIEQRSPQAESEYQACLEKLPPLKIASVFTAHANPDFTYLDFAVVPPKEWEPYVREKNLLETQRLREWITRELSASDR
jgi:hypothetical protein